MTRESVRSPRDMMAVSLPESHWKQIRDVRWPGRSDAQIDHVLAGPSGLYVIQYLSVAGRSLQDGGHSCEVEVAATSEAARAVAELLPTRYRSKVRPVLCLLSDDAIADLVDGVTVTSCLALEHILRSSPVVLSTCEVAEVSGRLRGVLEPVPVAVEPRRGWWARSRRLLVAAAAAGVASAVALVGSELTGFAGPW
jgi:hypothetical protein